jgi:hypothetical protein
MAKENSRQKVNLYLYRAYRSSSSAAFLGALSDAQPAPPSVGSAEINEPNDIRTNKLAKIAVAISFIEASSASAVHVDLLDVP